MSTHPATKKTLILAAALLPLLLLGCFLSAVCAFASEERPPHWAEPVNLHGSENFHKVTDELYRSGQPGKRAMRTYESYGIRTVINLRALHSDVDEAEGTSLKLVELPTHTWKADDDKTVILALQSIRDAEKPVVVHCWHGADRTGLVMAMYRMVEQNWSREEALREMLHGGYGFHSIWSDIVEYLQKVDVERIRLALK